MAAEHCSTPYDDEQPDDLCPDREGGDPSSEQNPSNPLAYFISLSCYGARLPGDARGTVDTDHNAFDTPLKPESDRLHQASREAMKQEPYSLDAERRRCVMDTLREVCEHRGWILFAAHVRNTHLHVVVHGSYPPERIGGDFKSYASRRLNQAGYDHSERRRWARHQSNPYLWSVEAVQAAIRYTIHEQGKPFQVYVHPELAGYNLESYYHEINGVIRDILKRHDVL